ncbi:MAG: flagellar export chaperone FlgN [Buchnera aphidicola (Acyrthosiphon caraganae)]|nr:MAG: flagellar export chaperone FlgN [Buchnera aphidicola (Acyrthosiphon caraganae)]
MLIDTIKKIEDVLFSLESMLMQEYYYLLNSKTLNLDILELIENKKILFKKFIILNQHRASLDKKYCIFAPYKNNKELKNCWNEIIKKCFLLRKLNLQNKTLINKKFYLNQYFLELFSSDKKYITYNLNGNLVFN